MRGRFFTTWLLLAALATPAAAASWALTGSTGAHDPTIIKEGDMWWCFTTGNGLPVKYSSDGLQWNQGVRIFAGELPWWRTHAPLMGQNDVWAPDLQKFGGRYWCYYSVSEFGRNNSAIGLTSCSSILAGDWRDDGLVISSRDGRDPYNAIDPHLSVDAEGNPWLTFGSWFNGIYVTRLDPATMKPTGTLQAIARRPNGIEGPNLIYANGWYYLFLSIDTCCQGANSTYKISCGRARTIAGPFLDKNNVSLLNGGGTLLEVGESRWRGPGGQDVYQNGRDWVIARHAYDALNNGRATLLISDLYWDASLWPTFTDPSTQTGAPDITSNPESRVVDAGGSATLSVGASGGSTVAYEWLKDGFAIAGATSPDLTLTNIQLGSAGVYAALVKGAATSVSVPAIVGVATMGKTLGAAEEVGPDIVHANGRIYDQVLLQGATASITADAGQVTRISYADLSNDIVQVEFSGAGTLTLALDTASGPAAPVNYNQTGVAYMKGHARIVIAGADETTNVSVFSVGRATALNQALFKDDVAYDGWANIASISILSRNGRFGGVRTANALYSAPNGLAGLHAPGVQFDGPIYIGGISAADAAQPVLRVGAVGDAQVNGGDFAQANGRPVSVSGLSQLRFVPGSSSHGVLQPARANQGRLQQNGMDVTDQIVVNPPP